MRSLPMIGMLLLLGACGGSSYPVTLTAAPTSGPEDVIACVRGKLKPLGYRQTSYDDTDYRLTAAHADTTATRADLQFRRNIDRLEVQAVAAATGSTSLTVAGRTFAEFETHRGPTEEEQRASAGVRSAAQSIVDACGALGAVDSTRVPG